MLARHVGRLLQPRRADEGPAGRPHAVPRRGLRERRGRAGDGARPGATKRSTSSSRSAAVRPSTSSASRSRGTPRRATRSCAARWRSRKASSSSETGLEKSASAASPRSGTSSASTSRPSRGRRPTRSTSTSRSPRSRPGRSRSAPGSAAVENFIATAQVQQANLFGNGQSLALQAQVSGLCGSSSTSALLRALLPRHRLVVQQRAFRPALRLPRRSRADRSAGRSRSGTRSSSRGCGSPSRRRREEDTVNTAPVNTFFGHGARVLSSVPVPAARQPLQRRADHLAAAHAHLRHARQPALPVVRHLSPDSAELASEILG